MKKRALQEVAESNENADTGMHEPLSAEDSIPTPPESPFLQDMESLRPSSTSARTPSPTAVIVPKVPSKEDLNLLSPGSWNGDKASRGSSSRGSSRAGSRPSSRPTTPSSTPAIAPVSDAALEERSAPSSKVPSRTPSRQSAKAEQGSDLEIKALLKMDSVSEPAPAATPVRTNLVLTTDEDEPPPRRAPKLSPKAVTPEPKAAEVKHRAETREPVNERPASMTESKPESRTEFREERKLTNRIEHKPSSKREPSPAPKAAPKPEPKSVPKPEPQPVVKPVAKPVANVEAKTETRQRSIVKAPSETRQEPLDLDEVRITNQTFVI